MLFRSVTAGLLILKKRYREFRGYVGSMILAAVIGLAVFPYAVEDIFSSGRGMEALQNLGNGFDGYGIRLGAFGTIFMEACFGGVLPGVFAAGCGAAGLLFAWLRGRKGKESSQQMQGTEQAAGLARQGENERVADPARTEGKEGFCIWLMLLVPCCCYYDTCAGAYFCCFSRCQFLLDAFAGASPGSCQCGGL